MRGSRQEQPQKESERSSETPLASEDRGRATVFEEFVSQLEIRIKAGDHVGFYKHLKGVDLEGRRSCSVPYIKDE